jgi:uncharacterized protein (DUF58 family)
MAVAAKLFSSTKDTPRRTLFQSAILRWVWRVYTQYMTQAGRWFFWPSLGFLMYGSITLSQQSFVPFCYAAAIWFSALFGMWLCRPRVDLSIDHADRVCAGETMPLEVRVRLHGPSLPIVILPHRLPPEIDCVSDEGLRLEGLVPGETVTVTLKLRCEKRGVHVLRGVRAECDYPFGLLRSRQTLEAPRQLLVYPRFHRLAQLELPSGRRYQPGGVAMASHVGESFEYIGNREYREGDNVRDIDWSATARLHRPIVREYREEYFLRAAVILDTHVPRRAGSEYGDAFESAVSLCAAVSDCMARQEYLVDIFAAGPSLYHLTTGRSLAYLDQILEILACVDSCESESFGVMEPELMSNLARISTVICMFLDWDERRRQFVRDILEQGSAVKVVIVRDGECTRDPHADIPDAVRVLTRAQCAAGVEEL